METHTIKSAILCDLQSLLATLFPNRHLSHSGHEWRIGTNGSLAIRDDGCWYDHEAGAGGDVLDLIAHVLATDFKGALAFARSFSGGGKTALPTSTFPNFRKAQEAGRLKQQARARNLWQQAQIISLRGQNGTC